MPEREPESFGYEYYLEQLREGHLDKVEFWAFLRFSEEANSGRFALGPGPA